MSGRWRVISWRLYFVLLFLILASPHDVGAVSSHDQEKPADGHVETNMIPSKQAFDIRKILEPLVIPAKFHQPYYGFVNRTTQMQYIYSYNETNATTAVRISVSCDQAATNEFPVLFVARQQEGILSWRIPLDIIDGYSYWVASRTLCPMERKRMLTTSAREQQIFLGVSTMSDANISFNLTAETLDNFELEHDMARTEEVSTSRPVYLKYTFPEGVDTVLLKVTSPDHVCMTVSIQKIKCPVMDLDYNVDYSGKHQTMSTQAAMYLQRDRFPEFGAFYVVFVVKPNNKACQGIIEAINIQPASKIKERSKTITLTITQTISDTQYVIATVSAVAVFLAFYVAAAFVGTIYDKCGWSRDIDDLTDDERDVLCFKGSSIHPSSGLWTGAENRHLLDSDVRQDPFLTAHPHTSGYGSMLNEDDSANKELEATPRSRVSAAPSSPSSPPVDESEIDFLADADEEKDIFRTKTALFVSDLSRKKYSKQKKSYKLYSWNLLTIAIFYALPAVQLVITYHKDLQISGNDDICYYNFACANPLKDALSSFNNVFSNIGYVMLGFLFILIVMRRNRAHNKVLAKHGELESLYGIPQFFGLYYAMGFALIMEGVMSASYHVCPTNSNFQFDTSFMYIIACLCMLKIYQTRHPDVNARAHTVYFSMAIIILVAVLGVVYGTNILWIFYALIHMFFTFVITAQIYFMGRWTIDRHIFKKVLLYVLVDCRRCGKPVYPNRFVLLFLANAVNWAFALYGAISEPSDFASYLLAIFIGNLLIYCSFYLAMKCFNRERLNLFVVGIIFTSILTWSGSLYFFFQHLTSWAETPAGSREGNRDCILMSFYDAHDVWHFLSAISLFLSFLMLFLLDDDIKLKRRDRIPVF